MQSRSLPPGSKIPTHYEPGNAPAGHVAIGHAQPPRPVRPARMQPQGRHTRHHVRALRTPCAAKRSVRHCNMGRLALRYGPFGNVGRPVLHHGAAGAAVAGRPHCREAPPEMFHLDTNIIKLSNKKTMPYFIRIFAKTKPLPRPTAAEVCRRGRGRMFVMYSFMFNQQPLTY